MARKKRGKPLWQKLGHFALAAGALAIGWFFGIDRFRAAWAEGAGGQELYAGLLIAALMLLAAVLLVVDAFRPRRKESFGDDAAFQNIISHDD